LDLKEGLFSLNPAASDASTRRWSGNLSYNLKKP
jgi:hypothetical protein